jgi:tetratricopeptide (TPR) repeat protein
MAENIPENNNTTNTTESARQQNRQNKNIMMIFGGVVIVIIVILIIVFTSRSDNEHYAIGVNYINQKRYDAALVELEKIQPTDKDYPDAVAKIYYVRGVLQFQEGNYNEAYSYFTRVDPADQFYKEARNFMDEIDRLRGAADRTEDQTQDAVQNVDTIDQTTVIRTDTVITGKVDDAMKNIAISMIDTMRKFEEIYVQSETVTSGYDVFIRDLTLIKNNFNRISTRTTDPELLELKTLVNEWMDTLLVYISTKMNPNATRNPIDIKRDAMRIRGEIDRLTSAIRNKYRI